jgi:hypothetical protein
MNHDSVVALRSAKTLAAATFLMLAAGPLALAANLTTALILDVEPNTTEETNPSTLELYAGALPFFVPAWMGLVPILTMGVLLVVCWKRERHLREIAAGAKIWLRITPSFIAAILMFAGISSFVSAGYYGTLATPDTLWSVTAIIAFALMTVAGVRGALTRPWRSQPEDTRKLDLNIELTDRHSHVVVQLSGGWLEVPLYLDAALHSDTSAWACDLIARTNTDAPLSRDETFELELALTSFAEGSVDNGAARAYIYADGNDLVSCWATLRVEPAPSAPSVAAIVGLGDEPAHTNLQFGPAGEKAIFRLDAGTSTIYAVEYSWRSRSELVRVIAFSVDEQVFAKNLRNVELLAAGVFV